MAKHIEALLVYEILNRLKELQRRGVGFIDREYIGGVDYKIDGTVYKITVKEKQKG